MLATRSADNEAIIAYANRLGSHDGLIFSGDVFVHQNGQCLREGPRWIPGVEGIVIQDVDVSKTLLRRRADTTWRLRQEKHLEQHDGLVGVVVSHHFIAPNHDSYRYPFPQDGKFFVSTADKSIRSPTEELFDELENALVWSLSYFKQTGAFRRIGIALSGGRDSILSLILAWRYAKVFLESDGAGIADFITCISMPTRFNSDMTKGLAERAAQELGVTFWEVPIQEEYEMKCKLALEMLEFKDREGGLDPIVRQNIMACIRADRMMVWSRSCGGMVLNNGNMSEKATGYGTILGDWSVGAFGLLGNLPKTLIEAFLEHLGKKYGLSFMDDLLATKASAELEDDQTDEGSLMPFVVLDAFLYLFASEKLPPSDMYRIAREMWSDERLEAMAPGYRPGMLKIWARRFITLFARSIYKWVVSPLGAHVGTLDLDRERAFHIPVVQSPEWLERSLAEIDRCPD
jgi:NAD+ synthase (glutamine-hydrolysing)